MIRASLAAFVVIMAATIYFSAMNSSPINAWHLFLGTIVGFVAGILFAIEITSIKGQ